MVMFIDFPYVSLPEGNAVHNSHETGRSGDFRKKQGLGQATSHENFGRSILCHVAVMSLDLIIWGIFEKNILQLTSILEITSIRTSLNTSNHQTNITEHVTKDATASSITMAVLEMYPTAPFGDL